jgi:hypothetical protein
MENDITANPDYQLIMSFLKSIRPGDMSDEAATQLKMIGERIQSGGSLSDQEREMFQSVMGAVSDSMGAVSDAEMQMYKDNLPRPRPSPNMGAVSDAEMQMMPQNRVRNSFSAPPSSYRLDAEMQMMQRDQQFNQDAQNFQGRAFRNNEDVYSGSSGVSSSLAPDTSMRPRPRPENLGQMRPRPRPASME